MKTKIKRKPFVTAHPILYAGKKAFEECLKKTMAEHKEALLRLSKK